MEIMMEYMAKGFIVMLMISMPCVLTAAAIGLVVGILQAVTQVQEQTIAAAPKILAVFLVVIIGGYGFVSMLTNLTTEGFSLAFNVLPKNDEYVLSSDYYKYTRPFQREMNDKLEPSASLKEKMRNSAKPGFGGGKNNVRYISPPKESGPRTNVVEDIKINGGR